MRSGERRRRVARVAIGACALVAGLASCSSDPTSDGLAVAPTSTSPPATSGTDSSDSDSSSGPGLYVSIGDSYAQGFQPTGQPEDYRRGYAYLVPDRLRADGEELELVNFGCGGATVGSLADDPGCRAGARAPDGPAYPDESQLDAAVAYLADHRDQVRLITVSIGGNDVTRCARGADDPIRCVADAVAGIDAGLAEVLPRIRDAAGPDAVIVGLTYPDVILGAYLSEGTRSLAELSVVAFEQFINPTFAARYEAIGAEFVDVTAATGAYTPLTETQDLAPYGTIPVAVAKVCELTWFCERGDIHPRDAGYEAIADLIVDTYRKAG